MYVMPPNLPLPPHPRIFPPIHLPPRIHPQTNSQTFPSQPLPLIQPLLPLKPLLPLLTPLPLLPLLAKGKQKATNGRTTTRFWKTWTTMTLLPLRPPPTKNHRYAFSPLPPLPSSLLSSFFPQPFLSFLDVTNYL